MLRSYNGVIAIITNGWDFPTNMYFSKMQHYLLNCIIKLDQTLKYCQTNIRYNSWRWFVNWIQKMQYANFKYKLIVFNKLECLGIRATPLQWFKSYLSDREQYVVYNETCSSYKTISCGVPQGSILGPLLFLLYINDLANVSNVIFSLLFADDSNMFVSGKNPDELVNIMNAEMTKIVNWLRTNKLSLNLKKNTLHYIS